MWLFEAWFVSSSWFEENPKQTANIEVAVPVLEERTKVTSNYTGPRKGHGENQRLSPGVD